MVIDDTPRLVRYFPLRKVKWGKCLLLLVCFRNLRIALRGEVDVLVSPIRMAAVRRYWSVFDALMWTFIELLISVLSFRRRVRL